jgi:glutaredoxin
VTEVVLYARAGCHLCDDAREVISTVRASAPFAFVEIDIETDDALVREYGVRIPVVTVNGQELCEYRVDPSELRAAVAAEADGGSLR